MVAGSVVELPPGQGRVSPAENGLVLFLVGGDSVANSVLVGLVQSLVLQPVLLVLDGGVEGRLGPPVLSPLVPVVGGQGSVVDDLLAFHVEPHLARVVFPAGIQQGGDHPTAEISGLVFCSGLCLDLLDTDVSVHRDEAGQSQAPGTDAVATVGVDDSGGDPLNYIGLFWLLFNSQFYLAHGASLEAELSSRVAPVDGDGGERSSRDESVTGREILVSLELVRVAGVLSQVEDELLGWDPVLVEAGGAGVSGCVQDVQVAGVAALGVDHDGPGVPVMVQCWSSEERRLVLWVIY